MKIYSYLDYLKPNPLLCQVVASSITEADERAKQPGIFAFRNELGWHESANSNRCSVYIGLHLVIHDSSKMKRIKVHRETRFQPIWGYDDSEATVFETPNVDHPNTIVARYFDKIEMYKYDPNLSLFWEYRFGNGRLREWAARDIQKILEEFHVKAKAANMSIKQYLATLT